MILAAIADGQVPGLVIGVGQRGKVDRVAAYGQRQLAPETAPATVDTVYDLASLTKALVTSLLVMKAVEIGRLHLDRPLGDRLALLADRPEVTLRRVLAHAAGFPAHRKFYESCLTKGAVREPPLRGPAMGETGAVREPPLRGPAMGETAARGSAMGETEQRRTVIELAAREPLTYAPGSRSVYSDLGFILLGAAVEAALGERLDVLAERWLWRPLGLRRLGFVDLFGNTSFVADASLPVAPTERCPVRGRMVRGEVHDLNAFVMGGIAGHAGLFGSIGDVLTLAFALAAAYHGRGVAAAPPIVSPEVLRGFWRPAGIPGSTWRLGWDGPAEQGSLAGSLIARRAVGHLSFTGCSLWIDPETETAVAVLCNRIHPEARDDPRFRALRPALHDAALQAIGYRTE